MQNQGPTRPSFSTARFWVSGHTEGGCCLFYIWAFPISISKGAQVQSIKKLLSHCGRKMCLPKNLVFTLAYDAVFESKVTWPLWDLLIIWTRESHRKHRPDWFLSDTNAEILLSGNSSRCSPPWHSEIGSLPLGHARCTDTRLLPCILQI